MLVGTNGFLPNFLLLLDQDLLSYRHESVDRHPELLVQLDLHLLARPNPLGCPDHARMVIRVGVRGEDRLTVPLLLGFVVVFLSEWVIV